MTDQKAQGRGAGEAVHNREHALELLDDTDSLIRFCSTHMMDVERYNRGSIAFWRVVHWIAAMPKNSDVAKSPLNTGNIVVGGVEYVPLEAYQEAMAGWKAATRLSQPPEASEVEADPDICAGCAEYYHDCRCPGELCGVEVTCWLYEKQNMPLPTMSKVRIPALVAAGYTETPLYAHPPKASPMQELQAMGQEFDAKQDETLNRAMLASMDAITPPKVEAGALRVTGEMLKAALLEEGGDAYMRNEDTPSHFLIDGIVDLDAVARSLAQPAPEQGEG